MNEIGIMQGRLSPPVPGRLQAFPWSYWEREFDHARACGFDAIEWLFEADRYEQNPIWTKTGLETIYRLMATTGVQVRSLCAGYFMAYPFFRVSEQERAHSVAVLDRLIIQAARLGIQTILLPFLEVAEIRTDAERVQLLDSLREPLSLANTYGIWLALETELPRIEYRGLIEQGTPPALGVYYDTGNAAARGYDIAADIRYLGPFLRGVHVKDRKRGGPSVLLGQGDVDFVACFHALGETGYTDPIVLETPRGQDYLEVARAHLKFVRDHLRGQCMWADSSREVSA